LIVVDHHDHKENGNCKTYGSKVRQMSIVGALTAFLVFSCLNIYEQVVQNLIIPNTNV
jgi:hypothetical protein